VAEAQGAEVADAGGPSGQRALSDAPPPGGRAAPRSGSMSAAEAAENGQNRPNRARRRSGTDAPEERLGALRPGLRRLRGPDRVP
jgi:hypothetical protein